ncbi:unnamed protein product [Dracunculus medinensis]|uniref:C-type lectin domain-containing protein n=1 Tax=Dracunculus medinensis TaxID=318479 RepID=A0A158Q679_DRAME|nr:unnamed protein product [Dracunculus medinensis]
MPTRIRIALPLIAFTTVLGSIKNPIAALRTLSVSSSACHSAIDHFLKEVMCMSSCHYVIISPKSMLALLLLCISADFSLQQQPPPPPPLPPPPGPLPPPPQPQPQPQPQQQPPQPQQQPHPPPALPQLPAVQQRPDYENLLRDTIADCLSDYQCRVFEHCVVGKCIRDTRACPGGTCPAGMVCVAGRCLPDPLIATTESILGRLKEECPSPWTFSQQFNACYYVGRGSYNFFTASAECRRLGGTVASIGSSGEMTYVNGLVGSGAYWIGYHHTRFSSNWEDGSPVGFTNYRRGQPDGCCGGAGCTLVNYRSNLGEWDDAGCHIIWRTPTYAVCKKPR